MGNSFNPNRSENIDVKAYANSFHEIAAIETKKITELDPNLNGLILMECLAHRGPVKHISFSKQRGLFTCCEKDRTVHIWNHLTMDLEGIIDQQTMK